MACPSCGSTAVERFCAHCGDLQPEHRDHSMRAVLHAGLEEFGHLDGKIPRTIWTLLRRPGALTREFISGGRQRFARPLSLFVVLNLVFFLIQPYTGLLRYSFSDYTGGDGDAEMHRAAVVRSQLAKRGESMVAYAPRFDATLGDHKKSMLLFAVPVFALAMAVVFVRARRPFMEHLVFSVHAYCFLLLVLTVGVWAGFNALVGWLRLASLLGVPLPDGVNALFGERALATAVVLMTGTYIALALRHAYDLRWPSALIGALGLAAAQMYLVVVFRDLLFYSTLYATT